MLINHAYFLHLIPYTEIDIHGNYRLQKFSSPFIEFDFSSNLMMLTLLKKFVNI